MQKSGFNLSVVFGLLWSATSAQSLHTATTRTVSIYSAHLSSETTSRSSKTAGHTLATSLLPIISRVPSFTPSASASEVPMYGVNEMALGIILAAVLCSITISILAVILCLAFRRHRRERRYSPYSQTRFSIHDQTKVTPIRAFSIRKIFSSHSANAPEVYQASTASMNGATRLSISRRPSLLQTSHGAGYDNIPAQVEENLHDTPLEGSSKSLDQSSRISLSRYHSRSMDLFDVTSRPEVIPTRRESDEFEPKSRIPPQSCVSPPLQSPYEQDESREHLTAPLIPAKNPRRNPLIHYPSWNEIRDFKFDDTDDTNELDRWRPDSDQITGRYELD